MVRRSKSGRGEIFHTRPDRPWGLPSLLYNGFRVPFKEIKRPGRGVNHPPHLSPRLKKEWSYTSTLHLGLHGLFQGEICLLLKHKVMYELGINILFQNKFSGCFIHLFFFRRRQVILILNNRQLKVTPYEVMKSLIVDRIREVSASNLIPDIGFAECFGSFRKLWEATVSFVTSVSVSVSARMERLGSHRMDFHKIWHLSLSRKSVETIQFSLKSYKNNGYFTWRQYAHLWYYLDEFFLEWEIFQVKVVEKTRHTFYV